jgi:hypothetical protein
LHYKEHSMKAVLALALLFTGAHADVLYSNFEQADLYALDIGETLSYGAPLGGDVYEHAVPFTVTGGDHYLDVAEVAILHSFGPDLVYADLRADAGGIPGDILESTSASGVTDPFIWAPPMALSFSGDLILQDGATYWLALKTAETDALLAWAHNVVDDFDLRAWRLNAGPWMPAHGDPGTDTERAVFRINATPVPAPGALVLVLAMAVGTRRR